MSRVSKAPVTIPANVEVKLDGQVLNFKGKNGSLQLDVNPQVSVSHEEGELKFSPNTQSKVSRSLAGSMRSLASNMVVGVEKGFEKKLKLVGVGYRAKAAGKKLNLVLGFSHPIDYELPEGITAETPTQTDIVIKGANKQVVGQVAAEIRDYRRPEPYKGKGVRYDDEHVHRKEAKKK